MRGSWAGRAGTEDEAPGSGPRPEAPSGLAPPAFLRYHPILRPCRSTALHDAPNGDPLPYTDTLAVPDLAVQRLVLRGHDAVVRAHGGRQQRAVRHGLGRAGVRALAGCGAGGRCIVGVTRCKMYTAWTCGICYPIGRAALSAAEDVSYPPSRKCSKGRVLSCGQGAQELTAPGTVGVVEPRCP